MKVRPAEKTDAEQAIKVLRDSITELCIADHKNDAATLSRWLSNKTVDQFRSWFSDSQSFLVVAETEDQEIVGVGMLCQDGDLRLCYLQPGWQRQGIGSAMAKMLEDQASKWGLREVTLLSSHDAQPFWQQQGFSQSGDPVQGFGVLWDIPYSKIIGPSIESSDIRE